MCETREKIVNKDLGQSVEFKSQVDFDLLIFQCLFLLPRLIYGFEYTMAQHRKRHCSQMLWILSGRYLINILNAITDSCFV